MNNAECFSLWETIYTYSTTVTREDCQLIAWWIAEENHHHGKHMLEKTPEELFIQAKEYWCCIIKNNNKPLWCIFLMAIEEWWMTLYERWSLFIKPEYRKQGLSYILIQNILDIYKDIPMYSITNVPAVKKNSMKLHQHEYSKNTIPQDILAILEWPWALLDNDIIYCNELLHILLQTHA